MQSARMSIRTEAEENLRVIRSLMEKATIYRAISAPGALIAGIFALAAAIGSRWLPCGAADRDPDTCFLVQWLVVLLIAGTTNLLLLARDARRRGEPFISPGMRLALRAMLPALIAAGAVTPLASQGSPILLAELWMLFFGISLLAASHFAPKSICWLGRAFFVVGCGSLLANLLVMGGEGIDMPELIVANYMMGATFGLFHVVYAACTWPRGTATPDAN